MPHHATLQERHVNRLTGVARATRQDWAASGLIGPQTSPYTRAALFEIVALDVLHGDLDKGDVPAVWKQVRGRAGAWEAGQPANVLVDLHTLRADWMPDPDVIVEWLTGGATLRLLRLTPALERAAEGFRIAATAPGPVKADQLAERRRRGRG